MGQVGTIRRISQKGLCKDLIAIHRLSYTNKGLEPPKGFEEQVTKLYMSKDIPELLDIIEKRTNPFQ